MRGTLDPPLCEKARAEMENASNLFGSENIGRVSPDSPRRERIYVQGGS